jgi:hypothetical protein
MTDLIDILDPLFVRLELPVAIPSVVSGQGEELYMALCKLSLELREAD